MRRWVRLAGHAGFALAIVAASTYLYKDLLQARAFLSHEVYYTYIRAHEVAIELQAGHFPQAFPDAIYGAGFAFPRFYPPLALWLSAALSMLVRDTCLGVNLTFLLSVVLSGLTMYFAGVVLTRDRIVSFAVSLLYVSMPYRFVDVFVRGALAEAWSFVWYPLVIAGLWRAYARRTMPWYLPVSVGALLLTHNITALYFLAFAAVLCMIAFVAKGPRGVVLPVLGMALGCGLAVWFLLPQQHYMSTVLVSDPTYMWTDDLHVQEHRVLPWQFFYSLPSMWYGESYDQSYADGMSFELGAGQLALIPVAIAFIAMLRRKRFRDVGRLGALGGATLAGYAGSVVFMMWPISFLTMLPKQFAYIQFPWRMLALAAFLAVLALVACARAIRLSDRGRYALLVASIVIALCVPAFERHARVDEGFTDESVLAADYVRDQGRTGYTVLTEYLPKDFDAKAYGGGTLSMDMFERPRFADPSDGLILDWTRNGLDVDVTATAGRPTTLVLPLVNYDFYRATTDAGAPLRIVSVHGFAGVQLEPGTTRFSVRQTLTPVSRIAMALSAMSVLCTALCAYWFRRPVRWLRRRARKHVTTGDAGSGIRPAGDAVAKES